MSASTNFLFRNAVSFHHLHKLEARASAPEVKPIHIRYDNNFKLIEQQYDRGN